MTITQAVASVLGQYVGFRGRARRAEFWLWNLFTLLLGLVVGVVELALGMTGDNGGPVSTLLALAFLLPNLAVSVRRLHDVSKSGWWLLVAFVPLAGLVVLLVLLVRPSTPGTNVHGPDPRAALAGTTDAPGAPGPFGPGEQTSRPTPAVTSDPAGPPGPGSAAAPTDDWVPPGWDLPPAQPRGGRPGREPDGADDDQGRPTR